MRMGKEVENLIMENNELLATKNALNIVKDDLIAKVDELTSEQEILREEIQSLNAVKTRMKLRIQELEEEIKRSKEDTEKKVNSKSDDEEDVPLAQRKRFTRVEMARVLMERNQYKERFMELQDAVRWTEMLRAAKQDPSIEKRNNRGILNFFSNLFSKNAGTAVGLTTDRLVSSGGILPHGSPTNLRGTPVLDSAAGHESLHTGRPAEMSAEKLQLRRFGEFPARRDQATYKQIKAHVRKDDGRMQAYGWSLPVKSAGGSSSTPVIQLSSVLETTRESPSKLGSSQGSTPGKHLPVPVPIYCRPFMEQSPGMKIFCASGVQLNGGQCKQGEASRSYASPNVWICTATHASSRVTVIDANRPADVLQAFDVCSSHLLCIVSVPGSEDDDFSTDEGIKDVTADSCQELGDNEGVARLIFVNSKEYDANPVDIDLSTLQGLTSCSEVKTDKIIEDVTHSKNKQKTKEAKGYLHKQSEKHFKESNWRHTSRENKPIATTEVKITSVLPTMWLAAQSGFVYIHSAVAQWEKCLHKVQLSDSVLSIAHLRGRTFVSMANGTVAIFRRGSDGQWDVSGHYLLDLEQQPHHSIRCLSVVHQDVWCGFRNKIHAVDNYSLQVKKTFEAHPRKESQVRQMAWCGDGVWVSIRLDSTLRLYHAETYEHLQDVDIEPYVSKMLGTGKLGFSYARITALLVASQRLWIGTGNGVIISVPLSEGTTLPNSLSIGNKSPGSAVHVNEAWKEIPFCSMSQAQLSFHGHRDAVKFFVAVPGTSGVLNLEGVDLRDDVTTNKSNSMLVISGGEGYIDFRVVDDADGDTASHLIVWKLPYSFHTQKSSLESIVLQPNFSTHDSACTETETGIKPHSHENPPKKEPSLPQPGTGNTPNYPFTPLTPSGVLISDSTATRSELLTCIPSPFESDDH